MAVSTQKIDFEDLFRKNEIPTGAIDCTNLHYETAEVFIPSSLEVFLDGVRKTQGIDYSIGVDNKSFDFILDSSDPNRLNKAPKPNEDLSVNYILAC